MPAFNTSVPFRLPPCTLPHWNTFTDEDGNSWTLYYVDRLSREHYQKTVFKAWVSDGQQSHLVTVKFCKQYGVSGHKFSSDRGDAPKLWFCGKVDLVQCWVVVMDFVEGETAEESPLTSQGKSQLREAVHALHEEGLVFGDLRRPNVIGCSKGNKIQLIDFEWCEEEGKATYPADIRLNDGQDKTMPWAATVLRGAKILKEHDLHLLKVLFGL
jgi:hypothetical protein